MPNGQQMLKHRDMADANEAETAAALRLDALCSGDAKAWRDFVHLYGPKIYRYCEHAAPVNEDPSVLASQVMQAIFQQISSFRGESSLRTWVYAICRRVLVDALRRQGRWRAFVQERVFFSWLSAPPDPEAALLQKDDVERMRRAMRGLPLPYKEVITLRYIEEYSIQEVAEILAISADLVKNRARLGKQLLRKRLGAASSATQANLSSHPGELG